MSRIVCVLITASLFVRGAVAAEMSSPRHRVIAADKGKIVWYDAEGKVVRVYTGVKQIHTLQQLENGNILCQKSWTEIIEINPVGDVVWSYDATTNGNEGREVEVHAFQRLDSGHTMVVENGIGRIIEVDRDGKIQHQIAFKVELPNAHSDVRMGHKLDNGHYLLAHEKEGRVTEYDNNGNIVWNYSIPLFDRERKDGHGPKAFGNQVYNALRLENGNTLIATGNGHSVLEVTPGKEIVWAIYQNDLPEITLAWVTSLEVLPSGNVVIGNCHAGSENPQLIEVTRDRKAVWTFRDFEILGNSVAVSATVSEDVVR